MTKRCSLLSPHVNGYTEYIRMDKELILVCVEYLTAFGFELVIVARIDSFISK